MANEIKQTNKKLKIPFGFNIESFLYSGNYEFPDC